jgi:hypothetical protein
MKLSKGFPCHQCAPKEWQHTPNLTGSYELDAVIHHNGNKDIPARLEMYLDCADNGYRPRTGYSGYHGYSGDD